MAFFTYVTKHNHNIINLKLLDWKGEKDLLLFHRKSILFAQHLQKCYFDGYFL